MKQLRLNTIASALLVTAIGMATPLGCADNDEDADSGTSAAMPGSTSDNAPVTDTDTNTNTNTNTNTTGTDDECIQPPDFSSEICDECRADLLACYAPPCDFEYDPDDCVSSTLSFPQCACAAGATTTDGSIGSSTTGGSGCEEPPDYSDVCEECRTDLLACYDGACDFEYDPNDCVNTTLTFPQCDCYEGGSSTG